jgi:hypothetical protein
MEKQPTTEQELDFNKNLQSDIEKQQESEKPCTEEELWYHIQKDEREN